MADPTPSPIDPTLATVLSSLGPWGALLGLVASVGVPFIDHVIQNAQNNVPVTPETWAAARAKIKTPFKEL